MMKKICLFLSIFLNMFFASAAAQNECIPDSLFPEAGNCGYDVSDYDLNMEWKQEGDLWYVEETITFRSEWDTDELSFDFIKGYEITSLTIDNVNAGYSQTENKLIVRHPGRGFAHDTAYKLYAVFHGKLQWEEIWDPDGEGRDPEKGFCMTNEPYYSRNYYICNDHPKDRATYHYSFTVPAGFTPAGVGRLKEIKEGNKVTPVNGIPFERKQEDGPAEGTVTFTYTQEAKSAPYLFAVCAEPYDLKQQIPEDGKVQLDFVSRHLGDPENPVKDEWELYFEDEWENAPEYAWGVTEIQSAIIRALESYFGPYPYNDLGFILSGFDLGGALETQGRSIIDTFLFDEETASHEIAHQWVGNLISLADWSDLWIKEGAAQYSSVLWEEYKGEHPEEYDDFIPYDEFMMELYETIANGETAFIPLDNWAISELQSYSEEAVCDVLDHDAAVRSISAFCQIPGDQIRLKNGGITFDEYIEGLTNSCDTILYSEKSKKLLVDMLGIQIDRDYLDMYAGPKESLSDDLVELLGAPPYCGGAVLYHCLRVRLRDEVFFRALQTLITENRWSTVNEEKFIEVFSRVSGEDLEDFIKSYLYYGENGHVPDLLKIETFEEAREKYKSVYPKDEPEPDEGLRFVRLMLPDVLPATGFSTSHRAEPVLRPHELPYGTTGLTLQIPGLDVMSPILTVPMEDGSYPVEWLENAVGLLDRSSPPGEGISIITGHNHLSSTETGPFLFLNTLQDGDLIMITGKGSEMLTYQVYGNYKIAANDFMSIAGDLQENSLVLITCEDESIDGGYLNRRVVFAKP